MPAAGEPLWLEDDLGWAAAYEDFLALKCNGCGLPRDDDVDFDVGSERCPGCEAIHLSQARFQEQSTSQSDVAGLKFFIKNISRKR